jgi:hypothetical protein
MAKAPQLRASWRGCLCALVAAIAVVACDLSPLAGVGDTGRRTPVETVTALEIDVDDLPADATVQARHDAPSPR